MQVSDFERANPRDPKNPCSKEANMKRNLINLVAIVLIALSTSGCSVVRIITTQAGGWTEQTKTETRETKKLDRKDVRLLFHATGNELSFRLRYRPASANQSRQVVTASKVERLPVVKVEQFNCLGILVEGVNILAHTLPKRMPFDGILGMDFIEQHPIELRPYHREVIFRE
jgi:hypothetical protein